MFAQITDERPKLRIGCRREQRECGGPSVVAKPIPKKADLPLRGEPRQVSANKEVDLLRLAEGPESWHRDRGSGLCSEQLSGVPRRQYCGPCFTRRGGLSGFFRPSPFQRRNTLDEAATQTA